MANPQQIMTMIQQRPQILIGVLVTLVGFALFVGLVWKPWGSGTASGECGQKITKEQLVLAKTDTVGKAIEIQALLARAGITVNRRDEESGKAQLDFPAETTVCERDSALITLVESGLMDRNIGLESFDKGDLTASREEKRIKLIRAQQGELSRLIRKIDPIEDASVSLSIPESTIFKKSQSQMSASVQVTIPSGSRLTRDKVRAIINLMVGSVQNLDAQHVALSDTNGNTYNSVLDMATQMDDKIEERDQYMKQKIANQLDRLVGPNNYVVTVSTLLREAPQEVMTQSYDPDRAAVASRQRFTENLNAKSAGSGLQGGPVSSQIPNELMSAAGGANSSNRGYNRTGEEVSYANTKTQILETNMPGMVEDISIAVSIDEGHYPRVMGPGGETDMELGELKRLIARAASPKVVTDNVSIAKINFSHKTAPIKTRAAGEDEEGMPWLPWAIGAVVAFLLVGVMSMVRGKTAPPEFEQAQSEIHRLQEIASQQQQQLQATQHQTQLLMEAQQRALSVGEAGQPGRIGTQQSAGTNLKQTLNELKEAIEQEDLDDEDIDLQIKSWIESS